jgi:hypothetical protein
VVKYAVVAVGLLLATPAGAAAFKTGDDLLRDCQNQPPYVALGEVVCLSYITGVVDAMLMEREFNHTQQCMTGVTINQTRDVVVRYLVRNAREHPDVFRRAPAAPLVAAVIGENFCGK